LEKNKILFIFETDVCFANHPAFFHFLKRNNMSKQDLEPYRQNLQYKQAFEDLGVNLAEVFEFTPMDLDLENRRQLKQVLYPEAYNRKANLYS
jgi:hypothetical protein